MDRIKYVELKTSYNFSALPKDFEDSYLDRWRYKTIFFQDDDHLYPREYLRESNCFPE